MQASWTRGGGHGEGSPTNECRFTLIPFGSGDTSATLFDDAPGKVIASCATAGAYTQDVSLAGKAAGDYLLQFRWRTGDGGLWYNCAKISVIDPGPIDCTDGSKGAAETDIDCGSLCPNQCAVSKGCASDVDCTSSLCVGTKCQPPVIQASTINGVPQTITNPKLLDYYSLVLYKTDYVFLSLTAPAGVAESVSVKSGSPPTPAEYVSIRYSLFLDLY